MTFRTPLVAILLLVSGVAFGQVAPPIPDDPPGTPYNTGHAGTNSDDSRVPLRDYLSSRIDQLRAEMFDRMDERDQRYSQRFEAQQRALSDALQAAKEAVANALSAAKEAVTKAEEAANKRFDSVNEFRQTLSDQANNFIGKAEANARLKSLEDDMAALIDRMDNDRSRNEGASNLWTIIAGAVVLFVAVVGLALTFTRHRPPTKA